MLQMSPVAEIPWVHIDSSECSQLHHKVTLVVHDDLQIKSTSLNYDKIILLRADNYFGDIQNI